ncbi:MFS transporter [Mycobacterium sp. ACS4331]|uniref:MFS transporter n=1 Tax=Mycobacterium sp. ACS4331 TaxID=1834121 RepID=UPI0007FC258C|nr:MFS transporter [Mycobacterium sp. ACS4331]OBF18910.1 tetracenomycin C resistance and export protein [Mycobacterium sp. ACS4331]
MAVLTHPHTGRHRLETPRPRLRGNPWWTLLAVSIGVIMVGLDASVVAIANPHIATDLKASLSDLQWITDSYMLALAALLIFGGKLGDRFGRRRMFFIGVVGFAAASVAIGLVGSVAGVIAMRAVQGVFGALLMPSTLAIIRGTFPAEKLNTAVGIWGAATGVSIAAGPIVGGLLVEHVNWESVFYINAPIGAAALLIGALAIAESRSDGAHRMDVAGIAALSGGLSLIVYSLIKAPEWGWLASQTLGLLLAGVLALVIFVLVEQRTAEPLLPMRLFANRAVSIGTAVVVINFFALFGTLFFMTLYLQNVQGMSPVEAGLRTLPLSGALMVTAPLSGALTQRFGPRPAMTGGLAAMAGALMLLTRLTIDSGYGALWPAFVLLGAGIGLVLTASSDAIVGNAPVDDAGVAGGLQSTAVQLGGVLGTTILGSVLSSRVGSSLTGELTDAGVPAQVAAQAEAAKELIAQGLSPTQLPNAPTMPAVLADALTTGSHNAFMVGLQTSVMVAAVAAAIGAVMAAFTPRGATGEAQVTEGD